MQMKKRNGFTLIELVIVVAIIGILTLMVVPQFNDVTENAKVSTFKGNCQTVVSAIVMYQAAHNGDMPQNESDLDGYINGKFASLKDKPKGASYTFSKGKFHAEYKPNGSSTATETFDYPSTTSTSPAPTTT